MEKIKKEKEEILQLAKENGMKFNLSIDMLMDRLDHLEYLVRVDQMQKVHDKMGIKK